MEILQLQYFCDSAECENFSKTAQKYNVPTSSVSQSIRRLERELNITLFDRTANKIKLNEKGRFFYENVKNGLDFIKYAKDGVLDCSECSGEIKILIATNRRIVTKVIEKFKNKYSDVTFLINHEDTKENNYDIIVSDNVSAYSRLEHQLLIKDEIVLAVSKESDILKKDFDVKDLQNEKFIVMNDNASLNTITGNLFNKYEINPQIAIKCDDPHYIREYVEMGLGVSFIPKIAWHGLFSEKVKYIKLENCVRNSYVFYGKYLTKIKKLFLNDLISGFKEEINNIK